MHSVNKVDENVKKIGALFPNCVTERIVGYEDELLPDGSQKPILEYAIDFDMLRQELSSVVVEGPAERYQFTWPDKRKSILLANAPIAKTLRPCRAESVDFDNTENLYIEGDNLDVLKLLQETYLGKIKMIYIDPPYNTGNDFVYNDDFAESTEEYLANSGQFDEQGNRLVVNTESNGRFHTDWLNMIYSRLKLARDLLADDGVIFISIDDNEQSNLAQMCNEIFGSKNCIGPIIQNKQNAKNDTVNIQKNHEFILVYRKTINTCNGNVVPTISRQVVTYRDAYEEDGCYYYLNDSITTRGEGGTLNARPKLGYTIYFNPSTKDKIAIADYDVDMARTSNDEEQIYFTNDDMIRAGYIAIRPPRVRGKLGCWTWALDKFNSQKNEIVIMKTARSYAVRKRTFVDSNDIVIIDGKMQYVATTMANSRSIVDFSTNEGTNALNSVLGENAIFNNPKNLEMIKYLIQLVNDPACLILDFFSGSATTAHAVMQLNAEDGGNRKFIMVQLPEETEEKSEAYKAGYKNICEIGKERIRRAGAKIKADSPQTTQNLDTGFRVLKLDSSNMNDVYYNPADYTASLFDTLVDNIKSDRTEEDLLFQVMLDLGVLLSSKITESEIGGKRVFTVAPELDNFLMACFDENITEDVITEIAKQKPYYFVMRDSSLASDSVAANFDQIFATYSPDTIRKVL